MRLPRIGATGLWSIGLALAVGWFYFWIADPEWNPGLIGPDGSGYYNLLARGFVKGHAWLDVKADPFLATLKNPWDPKARAGHGMHDASYFQGHYYLYYGVTPVVILFLPFRLLTGLYIDESLASPLFAACGLAVAVALMLAVRRRFFPGASRFAALECVLALGLCTMMPALLRRASVWEVPIACGFLCCMVGLAAVFQALHGTRPARWLAIASAAFGLAVGSRPVYILACAALLPPLWIEARERGLGGTAWKDRGWRRLAASASLPLIAAGLGLALYNAVRFGNPLNFGFRYSMSGEDSLRERIFGWRFLWYNLRVYAFAPARWSPYFPFVKVAKLPSPPPGHLGSEDPYGIVPNIPLLLAGFGVLSVAGKWRPAGWSRFACFCASVLLAAAGAGLMDASFGGTDNRYMVDFLPALSLVAAIGLLAVATRSWWRGWIKALGALALGVLLAYSVAFNVLAGLGHNELLRVEHPALYLRLAHRFDWISYQIDRWQKTPYGPIEMKVIFPRDPPNGVEPLVVTGASFLSDYLFVHYLGPNRIRFGLEHTSRGTFTGEPVTLSPGKAYTLRIEMGSLYPPPGHPYFDSLASGEARLRQQTVRVTCDGRVVFERRLQLYDPISRIPSIGTSGDRPGFSQPFTGRILSWRRLPAAELAPLSAHYGPLRLELTFPPFTAPRTEPLLCTGEAGRGDLVYVRYEAPGLISFGYDELGLAESSSPPLAFDPRAVQVLEIDSSALRADAAGANEDAAARPGRLRIRFNGQSVFDQSVPCFPCEPDTVSVGFNSIQTSTAAATFSGTIVRTGRLSVSEEGAAQFGPVRLKLRFPPFTGRRSEPLLSTGETGRGDLLYVRYEGPGLVSFGYDHWGAGGGSSPPISFDPNAQQVVEIDCAALDPDPADESGPARIGRLSVLLNGRVALDQSAPYYPCAPDTMSVGYNGIQASTAAALFSGSILETIRPAAAKSAPPGE